MLGLLALGFVGNGKAEELRAYQVTLAPETVQNISGGLADGTCHPAFLLRGS